MSDNEHNPKRTPRQQSTITFSCSIGICLGVGLGLPFGHGLLGSRHGVVGSLVDSMGYRDVTGASSAGLSTMTV